MKYVLSFALFSSLALTAAQAKDAQTTERAQFEQLSHETSFSAAFSTPDLLDPAIMPYLICLKPQLAAVTPGEKYNPREFDDKADCSAEREAAKREAAKILSNEGIVDPAMQQTLIGETLFVIDLQDRAMTEYQSERHYSADGAVDDRP